MVTIDLIFLHLPIGDKHFQLENVLKEYVNGNQCPLTSKLYKVKALNRLKGVT